VSAVRCVFYFLKRWRKKIEILFWGGEVEALLQIFLCGGEKIKNIALVSVSV
jgi:hypothetical protein